MKRITLTVFALAALVLSGRVLFAFCGFYVAKADTRLFNQASQVVLVRDGDRTVLTMANDFRGDPREFAVVIPVPTVIQRDQIRVSDRDLLEHLDAYSAPRLVEYFDADPCRPQPPRGRGAAGGGARGAGGPGGGGGAPQEVGLGVTIEAQYTVGEYDILILSAVESTGLETWLQRNGYRIPPGASQILASYLRQNMKFFVARVNLTEQFRTGFSMLRPIQVSFDSPKFMLPIRLGMVNADGPQELFVYAISRRGRIETTNYRTVKLPTGMDIPVFVKDRFQDFYKSMFAEQMRRTDNSAVFTEYMWDMGFCDPCSSTPLSPTELRNLGVTWVSESGQQFFPPRAVGPGGPGGAAGPGGPGGARAGRGNPVSVPGRQQVFLTRLHVRYDNAHFPEDLVFQETADRANYQGRYVLRHAWDGGESCPAAVQYRDQLPRRREIEAQNLRELTGWSVNDIRRLMASSSVSNGQGRRGAR